MTEQIQHGRIGVLVREPEGKPLRTQLDGSGVGIPRKPEVRLDEFDDPEAYIFSYFLRRAWEYEYPFEQMRRLDAYPAAELTTDRPAGRARSMLMEHVLHTFNDQYEMLFGTLVPKMSFCSSAEDYLQTTYLQAFDLQVNASTLVPTELLNSFGKDRDISLVEAGLLGHYRKSLEDKHGPKSTIAGFTGALPVVWTLENAWEREYCDKWGMTYQEKLGRNK